MVQVGLEQTEGRIRSPTPTGRYLYVGVGDFGENVVERVARSLKKHNGMLPPLTHTVCITTSTHSLTADENADRREISQAFSGVRGSVADLLFHGVEQCAAMLPMGHMPAALSDQIHAFVVADLAEPYGSALVLEIAGMLRETAATRRHTVVGVLRLCPGPDQRARVFASLRELAGRFRNAYPQSGPNGRIPAAPCFDRCFLIGKSNRLGELAGQDQTDLIARFLTRFCCSVIPGVHEPVGSFTQDERSRFATCGLSSSYMPRDRLLEYCRRRWCEDICEQLSASPGRPQRNDPTADQQPWADIEIPTVDDVHEVLDQEASVHRRTLPQLKSSSLRNLKKAPMAKLFRQQWERCRSSRASLVQKLNTAAVLRKQQDSLTSRLDSLVEDHLGGIQEARRQLEAIREIAIGRLDESNEALQRTQSETDSLLADLDEHLRTAETSLNVEASSRPRLAWYNLLERWAQFFAIRRARKELAAWRLATFEQVKTCCQAIVEEAICIGTSKAFEDFERTTGTELARLARLQTEIQRTPAIIESNHPAKSTTGLVVDHSVLPNSKQDVFYDRWMTEPTSQTAKRLLVGEGLLAGYRQITAEELAKRLEPLARERVKAIRTMDLGTLLDLGKLTPEYLGLHAWLSHGLWDYAEPLTELRGLSDPRSDQIRAELAALQVPDLESLTVIPEPWPYSSNPPSVVEGAECSVHLCRILQGFSLDALKNLEIWREAYANEVDPQRLHTIDNPDELPLLDS